MDTHVSTRRALAAWLAEPSILHGLWDPHCGPPYIVSLPLLHLALQISVLWCLRDTLLHPHSPLGVSTASKLPNNPIEHNVKGF